MIRSSSLAVSGRPLGGLRPLFRSGEEGRPAPLLDLMEPFAVVALVQADAEVREGRELVFPDPGDFSPTTKTPSACSH